MFLSAILRETLGLLDEAAPVKAGAVRDLIGCAAEVVEAGPLYSGVDHDLCVACGAYLPMGEDHKPDCAYVRLRLMLGTDREVQRR